MKKKHLFIVLAIAALVSACGDTGANANAKGAGGEISADPNGAICATVAFSAQGLEPKKSQLVELLSNIDGWTAFADGTASPPCAPNVFVTLYALPVPSSRGGSLGWAVTTAWWVPNATKYPNVSTGIAPDLLDAFRLSISYLDGEILTNTGPLKNRY